MLMRAVVGVVLASLWWSGCEPKAKGNVVAAIDGKEITLAALRQFRQDATANYREPATGAQGWRFYLQTMIDMELMLLEARIQQLDQTAEFAREWEKQQRKKLIDEYSARTILKEVDRSLDDMRASFAESKWNRMLRLAHIRTATQAEAEQAMRDLEQGRDFADVVRTHSIEPTTAARGGALDAWYGRGNLEEMGLSLSIGEALFALPVGGISQPFLVGDFYEIFKVLSEGPAPAHYRAAFLREQYWKEFRTRWDSLAARLEDELNAQLDGEAIRLLVDKMAGAGPGGMLLSPAEQDVVLCRFEGGQVTLLDFAETYNAYWFIRSVSFDSSGIAAFVHRDLLPRRLVYQAALREGLDRDSAIVAWLADKRQALLLEALREKEVLAKVAVDSAMARAYYDSHPEMFADLEQIQVQEILVATPEEAERIYQQLSSGEDMAALAARHSIRPDGEDGHYHIHNHPSERRVFGALYDSVLAAPPGVLTGPVSLPAGYSIFKVLERIPPRPVPFAQAASRAKWWVQKQQEQVLFDTLFARLRDRHAAKVVIFDHQLDQLAAD